MGRGLAVASVVNQTLVSDTKLSDHHQFPQEFWYVLNSDVMKLVKICIHQMRILTFKF